MGVFKILSYVAASVAILFLYGVVLSVYRLYFHPLAKFPGPKLAAATGWYEFYYEIIQPGSFLWEIKRLHEVYGKIVPPIFKRVKYRSIPTAVIIECKVGTMLIAMY